MVEYGNGIGNGPAGQVGGGGSSHPLVSGGDPLANVGHFVGAAASWVGSLSPIELAILGLAVFVGLILLRRVF